MDTLLSIGIGVGLSAACGFRVFVPLLIMSIASASGQLTLAPEFEWIGSYPALAAFAVAAFLEMSAYYIPWLDNLLDSVAFPSAIIAGTIVMASFVTEMSPFLKWAFAVILGGGVAGTVQGFTTLARATSTITTGGFANPLLSTLEAGGSIALSVFAITLPVVAVIAALGIVYYIFGRLYRKLFTQKALNP